MGVVCALTVAACGSTSTPGAVAGSTSTPGSVVSEASSGLQYEGAIATPAKTGGTRVLLSAPLFPDMVVFQRFQSAGPYDATSPAERLQLIDDDVKTYDELLVDCAPTHPSIKLRASDDPPLTLAELRTNYDEVANCGYRQYGAKPYWVPQYVSDVDICAAKLGDAWHLPTESDIGSLTEADFQMFSDTMTALPGMTLFPVEWYYRLQIYAQMSDGTLALGDLDPASTHLSPLPVPDSELGQLYLGDGKPIGLRCFQQAARH